VTTPIVASWTVRQSSPIDEVILF